MNTKVVGVITGRELAERARLFRALEQAFPVRFEAREPGAWRGLDAAIAFGTQDAERGRDSAGIPALVALPAREPGASAGERVQLSPSPVLDAALRGRLLVDDRARTLDPLTARPRDAVLASRGRDALWLVRRDAASPLHLVSLAPEPMQGEESLRDLLVKGRWLALLPLVHFLRELTATERSLPPVHACFVVDDPNLHWPSYGFINFPQLARHARQHGYHAAMAMIPLDGWFAHPAAARTYRKNGSVISLLVHGNNHVKNEFSRPRDAREGVSELAQAHRRIERFEGRFGVSVARVMAVPHGVCSEAMMRAMLLSGFEAICYAWRTRRSSDRLLAGWEAADLLAGGLPVLARHPLRYTPEELVFRAFLKQPLILEAHHWDFARGLDVLADAAAEINRLGAVTWSGLTGIVRSNFQTTRQGALLRVRLLSRKITLPVPDGVDELVVEVPALHSERDRETVICSGDSVNARFSLSGSESEPLPVSGCPRVEISLAHADAVDPHRVPAPRWHPWPALRRVLTEGRDRLQPVLDRGVGAPAPAARRLRRVADRVQ